MIQKDSPYEKFIDFEWLYGELEPGRYRIVKTVIDFRRIGDYTDYVFTAEGYHCTCAYDGKAGADNSIVKPFRIGELFARIEAFLCFGLLFGSAFQAAGFLRVSYAYRNAIEQEKKYAFQEFQQNKYILQSILYLEPELFENGAGGLPNMAGRFTVSVAFFSYDWVCFFSNMGMQPYFFVFNGEDVGQIACRIFREGEEV